ncbi:hypothetical protein F5Y07DRAFT_410441 [Xylaria sp. FL0933]|nr:hypothetical protein F5Y07DRAFT_410441 [Xylaria sp. FL0933]
MNDPAVGWHRGPGRRSTLAIIENCLFTIFACTWSIQHLNVPRLDEEWWRSLLRKCKWTVFTLFFPEFLMAHAILEFAMAVEDMVSLDKQGRLCDNPPWFFRFLRQPRARSNDTEEGHVEPSLAFEAEQPEVSWSLTHCYFANMGGFYIQGNRNHLLTASDFVKYWPRVHIPNLSEDDLKDKSKTDYFTKAIAVIQITQLILSLILRKVQHLAFSQLETLTLAFAICGVLTYTCSWYKPQDVKRPIPVLGTLDDEFKNHRRERNFDSLWDVLSNSKGTGSDQSLDRIPNDNIPRVKAHETHYALYILTILTAAFGSIHAIAWNFEFPTATELLLWRIATIISTALPPVTLLTVPLSQIIVPWGESGSFRDTCLHVMREYSWHTPVQDAIKKLKQICNNPEDVNGHDYYQHILGHGHESEDFLGEKILKHVKENQQLRLRLPEDFLPKFANLIDILRGSPYTKRLRDAARTDIYPQRSLFSARINDGILYTTSIVYFIARLTIIGLAFSSLRRMPESVYTITWTQYIPSIQ